MKEIKCQKCNYEWNYKGKLGFASCPNCGTKVKVKVVEVNPDGKLSK